MIRLRIMVEGHGEETFVDRVLKHYLYKSYNEKGIYDVEVTARRLKTGKNKEGQPVRGGVVTYAKVRNDLLDSMREDKKSIFTTMIDLYSFPHDLDGIKETLKIQDPYKCVERIEDLFQKDISCNNRFIPYIQLHEFEALLLCEPDKLECEFFGFEKQIAKLKEECSGFTSPEYINHGFETAPSKRIIKYIPKYKKAKETSGWKVAQEIGIDTMRSKCKHFSEWLDKLESLTENL